uniref:Uncharacterized protein n=1 Tax=Arundo donax TaxID=35708 RepID=A0A0A9DGN4_ARUDO
MAWGAMLPPETGPTCQTWFTSPVPFWSLRVPNIRTRPSPPTSAARSDVGYEMGPGGPSEYPEMLYVCTA